MLLYGRQKWIENAEAFHVYFGFFALIAPFAVRSDEDGRRGRPGPQPAGDLAPVHARQAEVEDDHAGGERRHGVEGDRPGVC